MHASTYRSMAIRRDKCDEKWMCGPLAAQETIVRRELNTLSNDFLLYHLTAWLRP